MEENEKGRAIWIDTEISGASLEIIRSILQWNKEDLEVDPNLREPIYLYFFSPGGDLDVNYALINTIELSKTPVVGVNIGRCMSAAAFIYLACHTRLMLKNSYFLFHEGSAVLEGSYAEIESQFKDYEKQVSALGSYIKERTQYAHKTVDRLIKTDWVIRAEEAIENGVGHRIVESIEEILGGSR